MKNVIYYVVFCGLHMKDTEKEKINGLLLYELQLYI